MDDDDRVTSWASGGSWQNDDPPPPPSPPPPKKKPRPKVAPFEPYRPKALRGLVAGRFDPLHRGHEHVIEVARRSSDDLDVVVFTSPNDAILGDTRVRWLREAFPGLSIHQATPLSNFAEAIRRATTRTKYDVLYGSEIASGIAAAKSVGATFVPIDPEREAFPTSGTDIRKDVMKHFGDLAVVARPWFVRRVAVVGAESTGKTDLCKQLARSFSTRFVPEPARGLAAVSGNDLDPAAIELWARTQMASEDSIAHHARRVLFADTDIQSVLCWSERLFDRVHPGLQEIAHARRYDLRLICANDVPFVGAPARDDPEGRKELYERLCKVKVSAEDVVLSGSWPQRTNRAREAVDQLLKKKGGFLSERGARMVDEGASG
jgi:NadR type nicotinamide-nucleotide adenylyltransferase